MRFRPRIRVLCLETLVVGTFRPIVIARSDGEMADVRSRGDGRRPLMRLFGAWVAVLLPTGKTCSGVFPIDCTKLVSMARPVLVGSPRRLLTGIAGSNFGN